MGCCLANDMTMECIFAKLSYLLGKGYSADKVKTMMKKNMLGELTDSREKANSAANTNEMVLSVANELKVKDFEEIHDIGQTILPILCNTMAGSGDLAGLKRLHKDGADLNSVDNIGLAPLHVVCCTNGNMQIAEYLVEQEINIDSLDSKARSPLYLAIEKGFIPLCNLLVSKGASVIASDARIAQLLCEYG